MPSDEIKVTKCMVCNSRNAKQHYGSWCCNGCKGFFWRTISTQRRYICLNNGATPQNMVKCQIEDGRRNSCRACRLKRCFQVGMDPNLIRDSWGKSRRQSTNEQAASQEPCGIIQEEHQQNNMPVENRQNMPPPPLPVLAVKPMHPCQPMSNKNIKLLTEYLGWIQSMAELKMFSDEDKNCLILDRARPSGWLILARQLLLGDQQKQGATGAAVEELDANKKEILQREIVNGLRQLDVTLVEFELLRLICFFSTVPKLSAEGARRVQHIQSSYVRSLSDLSLEHSLLKSAQGRMSSSLANSIFRIGQIFHLLSVIEKIAHQYD